MLQNVKSLKVLCFDVANQIVSKSLWSACLPVSLHELFSALKCIHPMRGNTLGKDILVLLLKHLKDLPSQMLPDVLNSFKSMKGELKSEEQELVFEVFEELNKASLEVKALYLQFLQDTLLIQNNSLSPRSQGMRLGELSPLALQQEHPVAFLLQCVQEASTSEISQIGSDALRLVYELCKLSDMWRSRLTAMNGIAILLNVYFTHEALQTSAKGDTSKALASSKVQFDILKLFGVLVNNHNFRVHVSTVSTEKAALQLLVQNLGSGRHWSLVEPTLYHLTAFGFNESGVRLLLSMGVLGVLTRLLAMFWNKPNPTESDVKISSKRTVTYSTSTAALSLLRCLLENAALWNDSTILLEDAQSNGTTSTSLKSLLSTSFHILRTDRVNGPCFSGVAPVLRALVRNAATIPGLDISCCEHVFHHLHWHVSKKLHQQQVTGHNSATAQQHQQRWREFKQNILPQLQTQFVTAELRRALLSLVSLRSDEEMKKRLKCHVVLLFLAIQKLGASREVREWVIFMQDYSTNFHVIQRHEGLLRVWHYTLLACVPFCLAASKTNPGSSNDTSFLAMSSFRTTPQCELESASKDTTLVLHTAEGRWLLLANGTLLSAHSRMLAPLLDPQGAWAQWQQHFFPSTGGNLVWGQGSREKELTLVGARGLLHLLHGCRWRADTSPVPSACCPVLEESLCKGGLKEFCEVWTAANLADCEEEQRVLVNEVLPLKVASVFTLGKEEDIVEGLQDVLSVAMRFNADCDTVLRLVLDVASASRGATKCVRRAVEWLLFPSNGEKQSGDHCPLPSFLGLDTLYETLHQFITHKLFANP